MRLAAVVANSMEFVNETGVAAGWTMGFERSGRELLVVAVKATFVIPQESCAPQLSGEQVPLTEADTFTGEPGLSSPVYESDYAHHRPRCDVLINGSAYAPPGKLVRCTEVGIRVGSMMKVLAVVGNRVWQSSLRGNRASDPEPFDVMPISYDNAFGGVDRSRRDPTKLMTFLENPVGRGFSHYKEEIDGKPLPNTEEVNRAVSDPSGLYRPMALGPIGRNWRPRVQYVGTFDQQWFDDRSPFWPDDFDYQYFQAAPPDQQVPYLCGGEDVVLRNLTPSGRVAFKIPTMSMPVWLMPHRGWLRRVDAKIDTLVLEPDLGRFTLTWRATVPMRRSCFDLRQVIAGQKSEAWQRSERYGDKPYFKGINELVRTLGRRPVRS
jgi:hypothetical protein